MRLQLMLPDHLFVEDNIASERLRWLAGDEHRRFAHGLGLFEWLWGSTWRRHAKHVARCPHPADWREDVGANALRLVLHRQTLGKPLKGGLSRRIHKGAYRSNIGVGTGSWEDGS